MFQSDDGLATNCKLFHHAQAALRSHAMLASCRVRYVSLYLGEEAFTEPLDTLIERFPGLVSSVCMVKIGRLLPHIKFLGSFSRFPA